MAKQTTKRARYPPAPSRESGAEAEAPAPKSREETPKEGTSTGEWRRSADATERAGEVVTGSNFEQV